MEISRSLGQDRMWLIGVQRAENMVDEGEGVDAGDGIGVE